jgi:hypothetical protein
VELSVFTTYKGERIPEVEQKSVWEKAVKEVNIPGGSPELLQSLQRSEAWGAK